MKNLKRALSLVLSTAMVLGMMVVGTGAAFADVKAEHNEEAIAVIQAAGIMTGDENGAFNPDNNITRNEMAVVMVNLLNLDTKAYAGASNFTDVPAWAVPYVDACYANGIVSGVSATEFGGANNVTTAQAALMMLKALGYFEVKGFDNWMLDTIKTAAKINMLDGIDAAATAALTRNEVAQLALNALESTLVVESSNGANTTIKGEGFEITTTTGIETTDVKAGEADYDKTGKDTDATMELIEKLFGGKFVKEYSSKVGENYLWNNTKTEKNIVVVADEAADSVVASETTGVLALYKAEVDKKFKFDEKDDTVKVDAGDVVVYYVVDGEVEFVVYDYELAQITKIEDASNYQKKNHEGRELKITLNGSKTLYNDEFPGFDYEEKDYVLIAEVDGEMVASELAEIVEGTIKAKNSAGKLNIGGTYYVNATGESLKVNSEITAVLNKAGQIVATVVAEADDEVETEIAYIYNTTEKVVEGEDSVNEDGFALEGEDATTYYVYVVLADGSKAKYVADEDYESMIGDVVEFSFNKDDEFVFEKELKAEETTLSKKVKSIGAGEDKVYANSKTEFVFISEKAATDKAAKKIVVETATGISNVDIKAEQAVVVSNKGTIELVIVLAPVAEAEVESTVEYAVLTSTDFVETSEKIDEKDTAIFTYTVFANGEEIEMAFGEKLPASMKAGEIFAYEMGDNFAELAASELKDGEVIYVGEDFFEIEVKGEAAEYTVADDAEFVTITANYDEVEEGKFELKDYDYADDGKLTKNADIKFIANSKNVISLVFVLAENK